MRLEWRDRATRLAVVTALVNGSVFALVAGWRTFVHAKRWLTDHDRELARGLRGESLRFLYMLLHLGHGIVTRPSQAPPYIVVYGGLALIIGLIVGLVLRTTALLFLRFSRSLVA